MSLIRSFTTRRNKEDEANTLVGRAATQRGGKLVNRPLISSPIKLLSSTNALSYEAPDIPRTHTIPSNRNASAGSSATSSHSAEDSDASTMSFTSSTDASSVDDNTPATPEPEPEPNHLSCYFKPAVNTASGSSSPSQSTRPSFDAPVIPQRVPSHSKRAHEHLHRKRSVQRMMSPTSSIVKRTSSEMFKSAEENQENPFGNELAQLDEVAEELSQTVRDVEAEADAHYLRTNGLACYGAADYLSEIHSLLYDDLLAEEPYWI